MSQSGGDDSLPAFGLLINAFGRGSGDLSGANVFPKADADDLSRGATYIPYRVTEARRRGEEVEFVTAEVHPYWKMPDGKRIYH